MSDGEPKSDVGPTEEELATREGERAKLLSEDKMRIDTDNKVVLHVAAQIPSPITCGMGLLLPSLYPDLFLTRKHQGWVQMEGDIDLAEFIEAQDDYLAYYME